MQEFQRPPHPSSVVVCSKGSIAHCPQAARQRAQKSHCPPPPGNEAVSCKSSKVPHFELPSWQKIACFLAGATPGTQCFAGHGDSSNAFWSFVFLNKAKGAFRVKTQGGGFVYSLDCLPFGWKFPGELLVCVVRDCFPSPT